MKKTLFVVAVAAIAMTACTNEKNEYVGDDSPKEIAFKPLSQKPTRAAVQGTTFPNQSMEVVAYQSAPTTGNYFSKTTFSQDGTTGKWKGSKYWPLSAATLNFFAISGSGVNAADITIDNALASASVDYRASGAQGSYTSATQSDIMWSFARGSVTQTANSNNLVFNDVSMTFQHALALINFQIKGSTGITVTSITLDNAHYTGSLAIANSGAGLLTPSGDVNTALTWTADAVVDHVTVPHISNHALTNSFYPDGTTDGQKDWAALMIIPGASYGFDSFTINYTYNNNSYSYTYAPTRNGSTGAIETTLVTADTKYTYQITMTLNEIIIAPTVDNWTTPAATSVAIP